MDILHITPSYKPAFVYGGPTVSVSGLVEAEAKEVESILVLSTLANGETELDIQTNKKVQIDRIPVLFHKRMTKDHSHFSPALLISLIKVCKNFQVIHIHGWWNLVSLFSAILCLLMNRKPVISVRGMLGEASFQGITKRYFHHFLGKQILKRCVLHATTNSELRKIQSKVPNAICFVLPNIVSLPEITNFNHSSESSVLNLIFIGRAHPIKGLEVLFQALATLNSPWSLSIAGSGDDLYITQLKSLAAKLAIAQQLHWLGWLSGDDKYRALQSADAMVLTSHHENFANVVVESLAMGTPVLVSDKVGLCDYVEANKLGRVCSLNPEDIAEKLSDLQADTEGRAHIRNTAPDLIRRDFDPQILARKYVEAYKKYKK